MTYVVLEVKKETHDDIRQRIEALGPIYTRDFLTSHRQYGALIIFGETALAIERKSP